MHMPYPKMEKKTIEVMKVSLNALKKTIEDMKKDKKADKKKIAALEKEFVVKSQTIGKKFNDDMKAIKASFIASSLQIEAYLTEAMKSLMTLKAKLAEYKKTHLPADKMILDGGLPHIKAIYETANEEMNQFGGSWNEYREVAPGVESKYSAEGTSIRLAIIETTKSLRTKVKKIEGMVSEAAAIREAGESDSSLVLPSAEDNVKKAQKMVDQITAVVKPMSGGKNSPAGIVNTLAQFKSNANATPEALAGGILAFITTLYNSNTQIVQGFTSNLSSMKKVLATGKSMFTPLDLKDGKVAAKIKEGDDLVLHWDGQVKTAQTSIVEMAKILNAANEKAKKAKVVKK